MLGPPPPERLQSPVRGREGLAHPREARPGAGAAHPAEQKVREDPATVCKYLRGACQGAGARLCSEVPAEHRETLFHHECDRALVQVAQGAGGVSILGVIRKPSGLPGQLAVGGPA